MNNTTQNQFLDCTLLEYHADPCEVPSLSASIAHTLISKSPLHAWMEHPKLGGQKRTPTKEMDLGQMIHAFLLGKGNEIVRIDADDWRSATARDNRDLAREAGKIPILGRVLDEGIEIAKMFKYRLEREFGIILCGLSEIPFAWTEETSDGIQVQARGCSDHLIIDNEMAYDVKTSHDIHPEKVRRHMLNYGCDVQHAAYTSGLSKVAPQLAGRFQLQFIYCEMTPPYCVQVYGLTGTMRELGERKWRRAVNVWADCLANDHWPDYSSGEIINIDAPMWALHEMEDYDE